MTVQQMASLIVAHNRKNDQNFRSIVEGIIADEEKKGHQSAANALRHHLGPKAIQLQLPYDRDTKIPFVSVHNPTRTLDDVILSPETRATVEGIVKDVKHWDALDAAGIGRNNRALLYGPPGCGKTTVVDAIASALGRRVVVARVEGLIASHLGQTAGNLAQLFEFINTEPFVLLIDEFDSVGQSREVNDVGEIRRIVNALLQLIDSYSGPSLIIAATNYDEILDAAFWRRFDVVAEMPLPDRDTIVALMQKILGSRCVEGTTVDVDLLEGMPHAAVEHCAHGAIRLAIYAGRERVTAADIEAALESTISRRWS
jgi:SpoVK/Ycf46/Vps4 family AAA+-type ATPase